MAKGAIGGGFQVDSQSLRNLALIADGSGQSVSGLAAQITSVLADGARGGLDIGTAIGQAAEAWGTRMTQLAGEATGIGTNLNANAATYDQTEQSVSGTLTTVGRHQVVPR
jgi:hypothetical protein